MISFKIIAQNWREFPDEAAALLDEALPFAQKAVELDPESALANTVLAILRQVGMDWIGGEQGHSAAMALLLDDATVSQYAAMLMRAGRSADARTRLDEAESYDRLGQTWAQPYYVDLAQEKIAEAKERVAGASGNFKLQSNLEIALNEGDTEEVKAAIRALPKTGISNVALYAPVLSDFDSPDRVLDTLLAVYADPDTRWPTMYHDIALLAAYFGDAEFALQVLEKEMRHTPVRFGSLWHPIMSEVRRLPAFKEFVTDVNLVAYWRAYGWADACHPLGAEDFECL